MMQVHESHLSRSLPVGMDDLQVLIRQEEAHQEKMSQLARSGNTTDTVLGGIAGAGIGLFGSVAIASGIVPGVEGFDSVGATLPIMLAAAMAGAGTILGSFVDLHAVANLWRR